MSLSAVRLIANIADPEKNGLLDSFFSQRPATQGLYFRGDKNRIEFYPVSPADGSANLFWTPETVTPAYVFLGIGDSDQLATGGTFALSYSGNSSSLTGLAFDISAASLQTALNANTAIAAIPDTVAVTLLADGAYQVAFNSVGTRSLIAGNATGLQPECNVFVSRLQTGNASTKEIQLIQIVQRPYVYVNSWAATDGATATVTTIRAGSVSTTAMFAVEISPLPYAGSFTVKDSGALAYNGSQTDWQTALGSGWSVVKTGDAQFTIQRVDVGAYSLTAADIDVSGLSVFTGIYGTLGFNSGTLFKRFLTETTGEFETTLEVVYDDGTERSVLVHVPVTLSKEILSSGSLAPSNWDGNFYTKTQVDGFLASLFKSNASVSVSSAGNTTLSKASANEKHSTYIIAAGAGSGSYTRTLALSTINAVAGDFARIRVDFAASANPSIEIRNATSGGTLLFSAMTGSGVAFSWEAQCYFDGTAWQAWNNG